MPRLSAAARLFLSQYAEAYPALEQAAVGLQAFIAMRVMDILAPIHVVTARAKLPSSLRSKCRRKGYNNPATQATDMLAVRVITYFKRDVNDIAARLRAVLRVSQAKSRDTRKELAENEFGYRSVHLVARLRPADAAELTAVGSRWFEVQVRSILDHAWSEIEHEAVYKSGVHYPIEVRRRFKALAASLEVLEDTFAGLTDEHDKLIARYKAEYSSGLSIDQRFDVARLEAFLELKFPSSLGWRAAERDGRPLLHGTAFAAIEALDAAGMRTARRLGPVLQMEKFRDAISAFAAIEQIAPESASHLAIVVLALAVTRPRLLMQQFPDIIFSPAVAAAARAGS